MESSFHYSHPVGASDSNAGAELLDIILMKVIGEADFQRNRDLVKLSCRRRPRHVQSQLRRHATFLIGEKRLTVEFLVLPKHMEVVAHGWDNMGQSSTAYLRYSVGKQ
ncbi:hypothetical protein Pint_07067 [Pistacia integerrima]|uniref:Uncharacterized protein n=1 Tax=Pistacia integerrima TaxID=434235 RepID=A0ACC0XVM2_9ROSI|nr:hypothetical protein Pint_07067 [Pistacia integerrima]